MAATLESPFVDISHSAGQQLTIINGHVIPALATIPDNTIDLIVTSPPYWGLRDYGEETVTVWDGDSECEHEWINEQRRLHGGTVTTSVVGNVLNDAAKTDWVTKDGFCSKCGAWRGQLGLEPSLDLYIKHLLQITAELYRVLKPTGVLFWNQGDSYGGSWQDYGARESKQRAKSTISFPRHDNPSKAIPPTARAPQKCMCLQNYRLLIRLVDEQGWILRNTVIWNKTNHMPSSVKDRFTNGYEPIFMLTKEKRYWFDLDAVREPFTEPLNRWGGNNVRIPKETKWIDGDEKARWQMSIRDRESRPNPSGKNPGDVWTMNTQPFPDAHFAVFPPELPERCIKCGCPKEICTQCGKARVRIIERDVGDVEDRPYCFNGQMKGVGKLSTQGTQHSTLGQQDKVNRTTIGWTTCACENPEYRPGIVLDPFFGSGTTMKVARKLGVSCIGIEISPKYVAMAKREVCWNEGLFGIEFTEVVV